jgi:hypothetical protein
VHRLQGDHGLRTRWVDLVGRELCMLSAKRLLISDATQHILHFLYLLIALLIIYQFRDEESSEFAAGGLGGMVSFLFFSEAYILSKRALI